MKVLWVSLVLFSLVIVAATSRGDDLGTTTEPTQPPPSFEVSVPGTAPPGVTPPASPFEPFDIGPPEAAWRYEQLSPADKAVADRGRETSEWDAIVSAHMRVATEQAEAGKARVAAAMLGLDGLDTLGVVP